MSINEPESLLNETRVLVDEFCSQDGAWLAENTTKLHELLNEMEKEGKRIQSAANGYPENPMAASNWLDGVALARQCETLAYFLSDKPYLREQGKATDIHTMAILSVCSHYPHLVGPAMIASAEISEKLNNKKRAISFYTAVYQDFIIQLDALENEGFELEDEDYLILQSLQTVCQRLIALDGLSEETSSASEVINRIEKVQLRES